MTSQLTLDLTPDGTKMDRVRARLMRATREEPVSLLDFDRNVYGTSVDRLIRFVREEAPRLGFRVCDEWKEKGGVRWKVYWTEAAVRAEGV